MEKDSGLGGGLTTSQLPRPPTGSRNMYLEMIQDKRGPYLCISGVGKSLACLPSQKISQECSAPSALPQIPAPLSPDGCSRSRGPQRLRSHLTLASASPGLLQGCHPNSHLCCPEGVSTLLAVTHPCSSTVSTDLCAHPPALAEPALIC